MQTMKNNIKKMIIRTGIAMTLIFSTSCQDWLSIEPENDLIREKFWTKTADVESALAAAYDALRS